MKQFILSRKKEILLVFVLLLVIGFSLFLFLDFDSNELDQPQDSSEIGIYNDVSYDEQISVRESDGYIHEDDLDILLYRSIARVEELRGVEFTNDLSIEVQQRDEFRESNPFEVENDLYEDWSNRAWFGLLIVPGQSDSNELQKELVSDSVQGYYIISQDTIVIVIEEKDGPYVPVNERTLIHEATHALQDQQYGLATEVLHTTETTIRQSQLSLIEGEARLIENLYEEKCNQTWSCIESSEFTHEQPSDRPSNPGYEATLISPYEAGESYMTDRYTTNGWDGIDQVYDEPPVTIKEILYPSDRRTNQLQISDISQVQWNRQSRFGDQGVDSLGAIGVTSSLFHYQEEYNVELTNNFDNTLQQPNGQFDYRNDVTESYQYDSFSPYQTFQGNEVGFSWKIVWDSEEGAEMYSQAYIDALLNTDGQFVEEKEYSLGTEESIDTHEVIQGPNQYQGYFSIAQNEEMVVITYTSAEQETLNQIRPPRDEPLAVGEYQLEEVDLTRFNYIQEEDDSDSEQLLPPWYNLFILFVLISLAIVYMKYYEK